MSEMVERAARAIYEDTATRMGITPHYDSLSEYLRVGYQSHARAAIAAMREPTEKMFQRGRSAQTPYECWTQMIDAALEPVDDEEKAK